MIQMQKQQSSIEDFVTWATSTNLSVRIEAAKKFLNCDNTERQFQIFEAFANAAPDFAEEQALKLKSTASLINILTKAYKDGDLKLAQVANRIVAKCDWDSELVALCLASKTKELVLAATKYFSNIELSDPLSEQPSAATNTRALQVFNQLTNSDKRVVLAELMLLDESKEKQFVRGLLATLSPEYAISLVVFAFNDVIEGSAAVDHQLTARNSALEATNSELRRRVSELEGSSHTRLAA